MHSIYLIGKLRVADVYDMQQKIRTLKFFQGCSKSDHQIIGQIFYKSDGIRDNDIDIFGEF